MKHNRFTPSILLFLAALFAGMFFHISVSKASFGSSPPWINNDHMFPGTSYEQVIDLSRSETERAMRAEIRINADDEKFLKWIEIENEEDLIMKSGQRIMPMKVSINIPKRAALKSYKAGIRVSLVPVESLDGKGGEVAIALGANISVNIEVVGDKITDYKVNSVFLAPIQEKNPFSFKIKTENMGNTEITGIEGKIEIYNKDESELLESSDFVSFDNTIGPDETKFSRMIFEDIMLEPGEYWIVIKALKNGEEIYENRLIQEIVKEAVPVDESEEAANKPGLPGTTEETNYNGAMPPIIVQFPAQDLKPAADDSGANNMFLILGLAGLGLGLIALAGLVVVLVLVLRNQQRPMTVISPAQSQPVQPPQPVQPTQAPIQNQTTEENTSDPGGW